jgi:nucleotide-binding universal stress UspA family protein
MTEPSTTPGPTAAAQAPFSRIVVPLDGSDLAESALPTAVGLARALGAGVHLLRVIDLGRLDQIGAFGFGLEYSALDLAVQDERAAARDYLDGVLERLVADGLRATTEHREGLAAREIVAALRPGDLLAIASHGRTGLPRWFIGSVAEEVVRHATEPVMVLRAAPPTA